MSKFNYKKAEADLYDVGAHHPDEIYDYKSEKSFRSFMKENGLNPDKYYKPDGKSGSSHTGHSGHGSSSGTDGCYLTSACVMAKGLPDHCEELETLRVFRDEYLAGQPGGRAEIEQYKSSYFVDTGYCRTGFMLLSGCSVSYIGNYWCHFGNFI